MVVATGFFDGVHLGHRLVINQLVETARSRNEESVVVTFWPHPRNVLQKDARNLRLLTTLQEKKELLLGLGVDRVEVIDFTKDFSRLSMREYLEQYVIGRFSGTAVFVGYDNKVGSDCTSPEDIVPVAKSLGLDVVRGDMLPSDKGFAVSSTKIRQSLEEGDVESAAKMLGHPYSLHGVVICGNQLGRTIGFPTANMQLYEPLKMVPANGVYFVKVKTLGGDFFGMCNVGTKPTVATSNVRTIETNIFDFDEDIYGLDIDLTFLKKIRDEKKFNSLDELKGQLEKDRYLCKSMI
jgi:riboflavin kinase/FMN adenylyltransferase